MVIEDSERQMFFQIINQLIQYNMQLTGQLLQIAISRTMSPPGASMSMPMGMGAFMPSPDDIDKIMKSMFKFDKDKLT